MANKELDAIDRLQEDTISLENLLPSVVWSDVCKRLESTTAKNVLNSSPYFRRILKDEIPKILFPEVVNVLASKEFLEDNKEAEYFFLDDDQLLNSGLHAMLQLRQVSSELKQAVDKFYESRPFSVLEASNKAGLASFQDVAYNFCGLRLPDFLELFEDDVDTNPIIGRSVWISDSNTVFMNVNEETAVMLEKFGAQIFCCKFKVFEYENGNDVNLMQSVVHRLRLMPNLKVLHLVWKLDSRPCQVVLPAGCVAPHFPQLEELKMKDLPAQLSNSLLSSNRHIKKLIITLMEVENDICRLDSVVLPNVREFFLELKNVAQMQLYCNEYPINCLSVAEFVAIGVSKDLVLERFEEWKLAFDVVNRACAQLTTIKKLVVELPRLPKSNRQAKLLYKSLSEGNYLLEVSQVKEVRVVLNDFIPIDFLHCCRDTLKVLDVVIVNKSFRENGAVKNDSHMKLCLKNQQVQLVGYVDRLTESNIFTWFPMLNTVNIFEMFDVVVEKKTWNRPKN